VTSDGWAVGGLLAAARFVTSAWRGAWGALGLASALFGAALATRGGTIQGVWIILAVVAAIVAQGALYRRALETGTPGAAGLQWGRLEWRLTAVWLLTAVFLYILAMLVFVVVLASAYAVASAGTGFVTSDVATWPRAVDGRGRVVVSVMALGGLAGLSWAATRISLAAAATAVLGRIQVLSAWPLTRGRVWPIVLARASIGAGPSAILIGVLRVSGPHSGAGATWTIALLCGFAVAGLWLPLDVGLVAYFYRRVRHVST
jgi:hypothetical protein